MTETTWTGVAMAIIALCSSALGYLFGWLKERDKLRFDTRLLAAEQSGRDCDEKHAQTLQKLAACEKQHQSTDIRLTRLEAQASGVRDQESAENQPS